MKKTFTIISLIFFSLINTQATLELVWQVDLAPYFGDYVVDKYDYPHVFSDDNVGIMLQHSSISSNHLLVVINATDGSRLCDGEFTANVANKIERGGPSTRIVVYCQDFSNDPYYACFERSGTNLVKVAEIPGLAPNNNQPYNSHLFYALNNTVLSKYKFTNTDPVIQSAEMGMNGNNFVISWDSEVGIEYRIQQSTNLVDWTNTQILLTGTGGNMNWANPLTNNASYYRLITE